MRARRTITSSGPLIGLSVEGQAPGAAIQLLAGGGTLAVEAWADCAQPLHELQLMVNGKVDDIVCMEGGTHRLPLRAQIRLGGGAWIAARHASRLVVVILAPHLHGLGTVSGLPLGRDQLFGSKLTRANKPGGCQDWKKPGKRIFCLPNASRSGAVSECAR